MTNQISSTAASARESARTSAGQFGTQARSEADLDLNVGATDPGQSAEAQLRELLEQFSVLPATDGRGNDFEAAFLTHYREAAAFSAAHPDWQQLAEQRHLIGLSGIAGQELGDVREANIVDAGINRVGEPGTWVLSLTTNNGGPARDCWHEGDHEYVCTGCVMEEVDQLPNYLLDRDTTDEDDSQRCWIYFAVPDQEAAATARQAQVLERPLAQLDRIREGSIAPWRHVGHDAAQAGEPTRWTQAEKARRSAEAARKAVEMSASTLELSQALSEQVTPADGSFPDFDRLWKTVDAAPYPVVAAVDEQMTGTFRAKRIGARREYVRDVEEVLRDRVRLSKAKAREVDAQTAMAVLSPDSEIYAKLDDARDSAAKDQRLTKSWLEDREARIAEHLAPFHGYVAATAGTDPTELAAEADRLETEATRQAMLVGWSDNPQRCPATLADLRR